MEAKDYKGYDLFTDVEDDLLQAWNRANTIVNITDKLGSDDAESYHQSYDKVARMKVEMLMMMVKEKGRDAVVKQINKCVELEVE